MEDEKKVEPFQESWRKEEPASFQLTVVKPTELAVMPEVVNSETPTHPAAKWGITDISTAISNNMLGLEEPPADVINKAHARMMARYQLLKSGEKLTHENLKKIEEIHLREAEQTLSLPDSQRSTNFGTISSGDATAYLPEITTSTEHEESSWMMRGGRHLRHFLVVLGLLLLVTIAWIVLITLVVIPLAIASGLLQWSKLETDVTQFVSSMVEWIFP